jgi:multicomponent Na+:H+ antiporter subunit E
MNYFVLNLLIALAWLGFTTEFSVSNLAVGYLIGFLALWIAPRPVGSGRYFRKVGHTIEFVVFFVAEVTFATARIAFEIVTPTHYMNPAIVAIPLDTKSRLETAILASLITLTPGSFSIEISDDERTLFVHTMYLSSVESFRQEIKDKFERRVINLLN